MIETRAIELDKVTLRRGTRTVLADVTCRLSERRVGLVGANGAGKSTLLRLLNGLVAPTSGTVTVDGLDVTRAPKAVRRKVGFVFQDPEAQIVMPTVGEEMDLGLKAQKRAPAERARLGAEALARFGLAGRDAESAHLLSGGEKQRLALACILAMDPDILVMDEPTAMLDRPGRRHLERLIAPLPQRLVVASHDLAFLSDFDRVLVLDGGRVIADGPPATAIDAYLARVDALAADPSGVRPEAAGA